MPEELTRKEAIKYLGITEKEFDNYHKFSAEIQGFKGKRGWWYFNKNELKKWKDLKEARTVYITLDEYVECFEFAIKMVYTSKSRYGTGIRGSRSEVQNADDRIFGILGEFGVRKFFKKKFGIEIELDLDIHPDYITPQDIITISGKKGKKAPKLRVSIKGSKIKSGYNIIPRIEYENLKRKSDVYIFTRIGLPSDHLFRILRDHSFFKKVREFLEQSNEFGKILKLDKIPVWICGISYHNELEKTKKIPGQEFDGIRYVKSVADMHNSDEDWEELITKL